VTRSASEIIGSVRSDDPLAAHTPEVLWGTRADRAHKTKEKPTARTTPWWSWCNLLSLDAPVISFVWALLFARCYRASLSIPEAVVLFLSVWVIYVTDRLLDGWKIHHRSHLQERHLFCTRHRLPLAALAICATAVSLCLTAKFFTPHEIFAGLNLALLVALYMLAIHAGPISLPRYLPKELAVDLLFTAGTTLPLWSPNIGLPSQNWLSVALFAALCSLNCLSIECWEFRSPPDSWRCMPHLVRWANSRITLIAAVLAIFALLSIFVIPGTAASTPLLLAIALSALIILLLNRSRHHFSRLALRVLVDVALAAAGSLALLIHT